MSQAPPSRQSALDSKPTIAIVTGGYSSELEIAYQSAQNVYQLLQADGQYQVFYLDLRPAAWEAVFWNERGEERVAVDKNDFSISYPTSLAGKSTKIRFDLALIIMHGSPGEDGKLQGYFDLIGQPYLGCASFAAALSNHKYETNVFLARHGILTPQSILLRANYAKSQLQDWLQTQNFHPRDLPETLHLFVKSNTGGSSIAMSMVKSLPELEAGLAKVFADSEEAIVEAKVYGREFTVGLYQLGGEIHCLPITEIQLSAKQEYFDFAAKYSGQTQEITPAPIEPELAARLHKLSAKIYAILNLSALVRMDFIYTNTDEIYFLEVNTIPGQTRHSIVPQQIAKQNGDLLKLYVQLINQTLETRQSKPPICSPQLLP